MRKIISIWFDTYRYTQPVAAEVTHTNAVNSVRESADLENKNLQNTNLEDSRRLEKIQWLRVTPFILMHFACVAVFFVGVSPVAIIFAFAFYLIRMFAITGFYHRYFSHKSFKTTRFIQGLFAIIGASSTQKGALWWAAHHRHHHRHADTDEDVHSPVNKGFLWSHMGWFLSDKHFATQHHLIRDFAKYPELVWIDRFALVIPVIFAVAIYFIGEWIRHVAPSLGVDGWQLVVWGFFVSTVCLTHATLLINSLAHKWGNQKYDTGDESRNNFLLAIITLGEGWHNNHHYCPGTVRQGFHWWQIDITYYLLKIMSWFGLVWDLKLVPKKAYQQPSEKIGCKKNNIKNTQKNIQNTNLSAGAEC